MGLNREEFLNIILLANHMANADNELHPVEKKVLISLYKTIKVTPEEQSRLSQKASVAELLQEIKSEEAQNALIDILIMVAGADGKFEKEEKVFIFRIMKSLEMNPSDHPAFQEKGTILVG